MRYVLSIVYREAVCKDMDGTNYSLAFSKSEHTTHFETPLDSERVCSAYTQYPPQHLKEIIYSCMGYSDPTCGMRACVCVCNLVDRLWRSTAS